jgi:hypothetical protein
MVSTIFGTKPPDGVTPIRDERVRGRLGELFLKARLVGGRRGGEPRASEIPASYGKLSAKLTRMRSGTSMLNSPG